MIHKDQDQPIKPIQQQDPTKDTTAPAAPTEVEGPPTSHLRSKTKQQSTTREQGQLEYNPAQQGQPKCNPAQQGQLECNPAQQGQPECNPAQQGQLECNPAQIKVNTVEIAPKHYSLMQWTKTLFWAKRVSEHKAPVAARCTLIVAMAVYKLKCNQSNVLDRTTVQL